MYKSIFFISYICLIVCLFLYSFTQVDLDLTFSRASWFQTVEKAFQYIGYFNRPLSATLFILILSFLFIAYGTFLILAAKKAITQKQLWTVIIITTVILTISYNAFSYDIFNYIFDAKIFTFYHQNPYLHKALDFPQDKMLNFMRWTHRTYPYGPIWLVLTVPLSFVGHQIFLPTFFLFKILAAGSYLGTCFFIQKVSKQLFPKQEPFNLIFFALNPLVLIESLVSGHIDIVMMFFCMVAASFLINKKWIRSIIFLLISIGIKFATVFLLPIFIYYVIRRNLVTRQSRGFLLKFMGLMRFARNDDGIFITSALLMIIAVIAQSRDSGNFQPWYLLNIIPLVSLVAKKYYVVIPTICMTLFAEFEYIVFLYRGNVLNPVPYVINKLTFPEIIAYIVNLPLPTVLNSILVSGIVLSVIITVGWKIVNRRTINV